MSNGWFRSLAQRPAVDLCRDEPVVADVVQCLENGREIQVAAPGQVSVCFTEVKVCDVLPEAEDRLSEGSLLNIYVDGVEHRFHPRRADAVGHFHHLRERVVEAALEVVHRLQCDRGLVFFRGVGHLFQGVPDSRQGEPQVGLVRPKPLYLSDHQESPEPRGDLRAFLQPFHRRPPDRSIRRTQTKPFPEVVGAGHEGDDRQTDFPGESRQRVRLKALGTGQVKFHAVVSQVLEMAQHIGKRLEGSEGIRTIHHDVAELSHIR